MKKHAPAPSRARIAVVGLGAGGSPRLAGAAGNGARSSRKYSATRPERRPIAPAPTQTTSPAEQSWSSQVGD